MNAFKRYLCNECGSGLIAPIEQDIEALKTTYICKSCSKVLPYKEMVKQAISNYYSHEVYIAFKDGGYSPIADCPECYDIYLYNEGICSSCGYAAEHKCQMCGDEIMPQEISEGLCRDCSYMIEKIAEE